MKALKIILIIPLVLFGVFVIVNAALPKDVAVTRERVMDDTPEAIFTQISDVRNWQNWSEWYRTDPNAEFVYSDPSSGVDAWYSWNSENPNLGVGKLTIVAIEPNESMNTKIEFEGMGSVDGSWELSEAEGGINVKWTANMEFPFFQRWVGLVMDGALGPQFEAGLSRIDSAASAAPAEQAFLFEEVMMEQKEIYYVEMQDVAMSDIAAGMGEGFGALMGFLGEDAQNMEGVPMCEYTKWDPENGLCSFKTFVSVNTDKAPSPPVMEGMTPGGRYMTTAHMGAHEEMTPVYMAAEEYVVNQGWQMVGGPIEEYITDPGAEPDTAKWITNIYWPIGDAATES